ncbi:MAG: hypothetical protein DRM99_03200 [Thermoplasmata archaeon]|nr:MAG: hypothetical protein DRM99_03200 [Thermoplasmata archaeon]
MKLNLGCGGDYKKGYLNVDAFDDTIADEIMSATDLKIEDNSVEEILMSQVIEHFGIARSLYVLSECLRVLKPGGKLIIETPDIRKSFEIYLKGEREDRKNILPWIYGVDIPGMQHRFCFPDDLLEEELEKIGFINVEKSYFEFDEYEPILRVDCEKPQEQSFLQLITKLRKKLLKNKEVDLDDQLTALEQERLIEFFISELRSLNGKQDNKIFEKIMIEGGTKSPRITRIFIEILMDQQRLPYDIGEKYIKILKKLDETNFLNMLVKKLVETNGFVGEQEKLFDVVYNYGKGIIKKLLTTSFIEDNMFKDSYENEYDDDFKYEHNILSEKLLMLKANRLFQKGVKAFNLEKYDNAIMYFKKSLMLYRDQILTYWNLGRLYILSDKINTAQSYYRKALSLFKVINYEKEEELKKILGEEMNKEKTDDYNNPLISLRQIYENLE